VDDQTTCQQYGRPYIIVPDEWHILLDSKQVHYITLKRGDDLVPTLFEHGAPARLAGDPLLRGILPEVLNDD
jgi:hypothetical protein